MESKAANAGAAGGKIKLCCSIRIKPRFTSESGIDDYNDTTLKVGRTSLGPFTSIIGPQEGQSSTFGLTMLPLVDSFAKGINCTVFMYGQTGSGKTHSLFGPPKFFNLGQD